MEETLGSQVFFAFIRITLCGVIAGHLEPLGIVNPTDAPRINLQGGIFISRIFSMTRGICFFEGGPRSWLSRSLSPNNRIRLSQGDDRPLTSFQSQELSVLFVNSRRQSFRTIEYSFLNCNEIYYPITYIRNVIFT